MARRQLWQKPVLRMEGEMELHRPVTWLELFFDLFFVVVIASVTHTLAGNINLKGVQEFILTFIPIWWVWIGYTYYNERFETEGLENRLFAFLLMIPVSGMAIFSHHALYENFVGFIGSYLIARFILWILWTRAAYHSKEFRQPGIGYSVGFGVAILFGIASIFAEHELRYALFGVALVIDLLAPMIVFKHEQKSPKFTKTKLPERFGLFTIIILGEVLVGTINGITEHGHFELHTLLVGVLGLAIGFGLWWIYFDFIGRRPFHDNRWYQFGWAYLHMPLLICMVSVGAGLVEAIGHDGHLSKEIRLFLFSALGLTLVLIGVIESMLERKEDEPMHPIWSPALKIGSGTVVILLGFMVTHIHTSIMLGILLFSLVIQAFYGAYVWFTQELTEEQIKAFEEEDDLELG